MANVLFLCDVDGCVAPMPWQRTLAAGESPSELDFALGRVKWDVEFLTADPVTHFAVSEIDSLMFDDGFRQREVQVRLSAEMLGRLRALVKNPVVDFRWLSMWNGNTQGRFAELVGFEAPFVPTRTHASELYDYFKAWAAADLLESGYTADAVVWLDDEHNRQWVNWSEDAGPVGNARRFSRSWDGPMLVIRTDRRWGISRAEMARVESFIEDFSRG